MEFMRMVCDECKTKTATEWLAIRGGGKYVCKECKEKKSKVEVRQERVVSTN